MLHFECFRLKLSCDDNPHIPAALGPPLPDGRGGGGGEIRMSS